MSALSSSNNPTVLPRVTELSNPVTDDIDMTTYEGIVRMLSTSDSQLFTGYHGLISLSDPEMINILARTSRLIIQTLQHPQGQIIFSGCGTSGRLSHLESVSCNQLVSLLYSKYKNNNSDSHHEYYDYLLAGGDAALLLAQEAAEDKPDAGRGDIQTYLSSLVNKYNLTNTTTTNTSKIPIIVIGISCGLSATYVGSMLEYVLECNGSIPLSSSMYKDNKQEMNLIQQHSQYFDCTAIALGFNPITAVAQVRVEGWPNSFYQILSIMNNIQQEAISNNSTNEKALIINPIVGPESIAGSSRMKGGSATKIIIETITVGAIEYLLKYQHSQENLPVSSINLSMIENRIREIFLQYECTIRQVYHHVPTISNMVRIASTAVTTNIDRSTINTIALSRIQQNLSFISPTHRGRIIYIGVGSAGLIGLIDASECSPTYGTFYNDVRGYLGGSWEELKNKEGKKVMYLPKHTRGDNDLDTSSYPEIIRIGVTDGFLDDVLPTLNKADVVILLVISGDGTYINNEINNTYTLSAPLLRGLEGLQKAKDHGATTSYVYIQQNPSISNTIPKQFIQHQEEINIALNKITSNGITVPLQLTNIPMIIDSSSLSLSSTNNNQQLPQYYSQLAIKLILNSITTGAHIRKGTIYRNRMINLGLTNVKLFHRAVNIVEVVVHCSTDIARRSVLRAIYKVDDEYNDIYAEKPIAELSLRPILSHVSAASAQLNIVPLAIVLAANNYQISLATSDKPKVISTLPPYLTIQQAIQLLTDEPIIRKAIAKALQLS